MFKNTGFTVLAIFNSNIKGKISVSYFRYETSVTVNSLILDHYTSSDQYILYHNKDYSHIQRYIDNDLNISFESLSKIEHMLLLEDGSFVVEYNSLSIDYTNNNLDIIENL